MGMHHYSYQGYGFSMEKATNIDLIKDIVIELVELDKDEINMIKESKSVYELYQNIYNTCCDCVAYIVAEWMTNNFDVNPKGIKFDGYIGQSDCDTEETIMFSETYPWLLTEEEKTLTLEDLREILSKFAEMLGVPPGCIDYQSLEYYG